MAFREHKRSSFVTCDGKEYRTRGLGRIPSASSFVEAAVLPMSEGHTHFTKKKRLAQSEY